MQETWAHTALCFDTLSGISSRKEIIKRLSLYYSALNMTELIESVYLSIARISSESNGVEMNIGENILLKALSKFSSLSVENLKKKMKEKGDISSVITVKNRPKLFFIRKNQVLYLSEVFSCLKGLSEMTGKDSTAQKVQKIAELLTRCSVDEEIKYIIRIIDGKMKIRLSTQSILCGLGLSFKERFGLKNSEKTVIFDSENGKIQTENNLCSNQIEWTDDENKVMEDIKEAYAQLPSFEKIIKNVFSNGISSLSSDLITPGYPLRPMLAIPEKSPETVSARFKSEYLVEYKYDGERVQAHYFNGKIELFSRGLESTTERFNQLIDPLKKSNKTGESFIIDAEVVAYCRDTQKILSFQTLSNRKRKFTESNAGKSESDIALFIFDILYLGRPLNKMSIRERKKILNESFTQIKGEIFIAESFMFCTNDLERLNKIFSDSLASGCEGVMVKSADETDSGYEPSKRSQKWVKLKSDYITGLFETLDLLVIGGYTGKGKRTGVYGGFLLGCLNENGVVETITKIGTGFSEAVLEDLSKELKSCITTEAQTEISIQNTPDVWFKPVTVWEVAAAGFSVSSEYTAGMGAFDLPDGKGISLRFPRFIRQRDDKAADSSTSSEQLLHLFRASQQ
ncbi:DNA ligase 1 [Nematocida parisii]|nr:DNA ligase 1 [Nematocida parisii]KAI5157801.1 DNA ligase 1 [Nematocida parisii]